MPTRIDQANDALWAAIQSGFGDAVTLVRNPDGTKAPAASKRPALFVAQQDGVTPEVLRVLCGPIYDLKLEVRVSFVQLGTEADRRDRRGDAVVELAAILAQDPSLGGTVTYAHLDAPEMGEPDQLHWLAGALSVPVCLLLDAPTPAG